VIEASNASPANPAPIVLVGGVGLPWLRDLDFGTQFIRRVEGEVWPDGVVIEDLSYAAHRVLHLLQDLAPAKVVLVGAMPRGIDPPGTVRRYRLDLTPPSGEEVHERLTEAAGGIIDLDHTLAVGRHWHGFPDNTVVIEVEPADRSFGLGFSEPVEAVVDSVLAMVHEEVEGVDERGGQISADVAYSPPPSSDYTPSGFAGFAALPGPTDPEVTA
jgi:hydrogenase maturation protease